MTKKYRRKVASIKIPEFSKKFRERYKLTKDDLSDKQIRDIINLTFSKIKEWILNNKEGFKMPEIGGYLAISKYLPYQVRDDNDVTLEKLDELEASGRFRPNTIKYMRKKYEANLEKAKYFKAASEQPNQTAIYIPNFLFNYRLMYFNKRNVETKKAEGYQIKIASRLKKEILQKVKADMEYDVLNFHDFYEYKNKPLD